MGGRLERLRLVPHKISDILRGAEHRAGVSVLVEANKTG